MPRTFTLCLALLCSTALARCQTPANRVTMNGNEPLIFRALDSVSSATANVGDPLRFELIRPVSVGDLTIIPAGAIANGRFALVEKSAPEGGAANSPSPSKRSMLLQAKPSGSAPMT